jgi:OPT family oligopeptide transporter
MRVYLEVPHWWYAILGIFSVILLSIAIETFPTELPIWGMLLGLLLSGILAIPITMIQAIANQPIGLNVVSELIAGYLFEGKPVANMIFKGIGVMVCGQAAAFSGDMKLGHYMKVPPRIMFTAQTLAVFISCFIVEGVQSAMLANIPDICTPSQKDGYTCNTTNTFATASLIWGGIGPRRLFSPGAMYVYPSLNFHSSSITFLYRYHKLLLFLPLGALAPIPFYFLSRRYPYSIWRYVNTPVLFAGITEIPPATGINYASWGITGFIFNFFLRRRHFRWWMQYNYILSAALDSGVILCTILIFFVLQLPKGGINLNWWGNTVGQNTADANGTPFLTLSQGETFGPKTWS